MEESQIFKDTKIKPYKIDIKNNKFVLGFGKNKNKIGKCPITVYGFGYYNCKEPKAKDKCSRYYLELNISERDEGKTLVAIMLNPSNTFSDRIDSTVKNVVRIAYKLGYYSKVIILNSFSYIDGNSNTAKEVGKKYCSNDDLQIIYNVVSENRDLMIAWGTKITKKTEKEILKKIHDIKNLKIFAYAWNYNSKCPYHPASRVDNQKSQPLSNFFLGKKDEEPLYINEDKYILEKQHS